MARTRLEASVDARAQKLNFEATARRLVATNVPDALRCATDIRERIEIVHTSEYGNFLQHLFPAFRNILLRSPPALDQAEGAMETRFRHLILEILNRLPNNEVLRPYAPELLRIATETLSRDTEENALTCLRIIFDLHKNFRPALESEVQRFLDLVQRIYRLLPTSVNETFSVSLQHRAHAKLTISPDDAVGASFFNRPDSETYSKAYVSTSSEALPSSRSIASSTLRGLDSFKVLTECPLIVMLLFQLYPKYIQENIPLLTPLMMSGLALRAPPPAYKLQRERYREFVACQVKTLSFLTYLLRGFSELMKPYEEAISRAVIALMVACPGDAISTRKELLVATRHILATEFRRGFYHHINTLLNETVLVGTGRSSRDALRPLAFSTLADLVHHVRAELDLSQLSRVLMLFSRNLHDPALPLNIQTTSVRLLLNLVDFIFHNSGADKARGKRLLVHVLKAMAAKFDTLRFYILHIYAASGAGGSTASYGGRLSFKSTDRLPMAKNIRSEIVRSLILPTAKDSMADVKLLMQTLVRGLKTVIWCISHYQQSKVQQSKMELSHEDGHCDVRRHRRNRDTHVARERHPHEPASKLSRDEAETVSLFFYWGLLCCRVLATRDKTKQLKEILDNFASAFTVLTYSDVVHVVGQHVPMLFDTMLEAPSLLTIAQTLLANSHVSAAFAETFVGFLVGKLRHLSNFELTRDPNLCLHALTSAATSKDVENGAAMVPPPHYASTLLRLFRILLGSVALFPQNEFVLRGRLRTLVCSCLQLAASVDRPIAYYFLLRSIFRSVTSCATPAVGGVQAIQTEFGEISAFALNALIQQRAQVEESTALHSILTELCMTVPMSLAAAVPFLPRLLPLLCAAVQIPAGDLPSLGLRTLEYYLDHLGPTHLFSLFTSQPQLHVDMMMGVCAHLEPAPYMLGTIALRILGKLGGRNRHFLELTGSHFPHIAVDAASSDLPLMSQRHSSIGISLRWRGPPSEWPEYQDSTSSGLLHQSMSFVLNIDPCLSHICELFKSLVQVSLQHKNETGSTLIAPLLDRHQTLCFRLLSGVLCSLFELPTWPKFPRHNTSPSDAWIESLSAVHRHDVRFGRLLHLILCSAAHSRLEREATPLLQSLSFIFAVLLYCAHDWGGIGIARVEHLCSPGHSLHAFISTLLEAATDSSCKKLASTAYGALKHHVGCMYFLEVQMLQPDSKPKSLLVSNVISRICFSLRRWDVSACRRVCQILCQLLDTFGHAWAYPNKHTLAKALIDAVESHGSRAVLLSETGIAQVLHALLQAPCSAKNETRLLVHLFACELSNVNAAVRLVAQSGLVELNRLSGLDQMSSEFLRHIGPNLMHMLVACHLNQVAATDTIIGALDALTYMMALKPPLILPDIALQECVLRSISRHRCMPPCCSTHMIELRDFGWMSQSARFCASFNLFIVCHNPSMLSHSDYLLTTGLRAVHSMIRAVKLIALTFVKAKRRSCLNSLIEFREEFNKVVPLAMLQEFLKLVLASLANSTVKIVLLSSVALLREILALGDPSLTEICSSQLNSLLMKVPLNSRSTSIQHLNSLTTMISLPIPCSVNPNVLFDAFLSCMQDISLQDNTMTAIPWIGNVPVEVATRLVALVTRLCRDPDDVQSLLKSVLMMVTRLHEGASACLSNYSMGDARYPYYVTESGLSFFRNALAQFLSSRASAAISFFLNPKNISNAHHVAFLNSLLSTEAAADFQLRLLGSEGVEFLVHSAFSRPLKRVVELSRIRKRVVSVSCSLPTFAETHANGTPSLSDHPLRSKYYAMNAPDGPDMAATGKQAQFHGLLILISLQQLDPHLFARHKVVGDVLVALWRCHTENPNSKSTQALVPDENVLRHHRETFLMTQGLVGYCRLHPEEVQILFDMLSVFILPTPIDFTFLKDFYRNEVALAWRPEYKKGILLFFLNLLADQRIAMELKVLALRFIVTPMLISTFESKRSSTKVTWSTDTRRLLSAGSLNVFVRCALDTANRKVHWYSEALRVELLKLTTVLIEHLGQELVEHRKDLIKFAWNHLKSEDSLSKQWAYVNVCRFVATYETPPKIILQVYVALLRTFQPEARELVKVALDVLIPALPKRLPMADFIKAIKWTKKIMYEEGHALAQLVHMWQLVVRHPTLFFPYRSQFMPQMVNSLNRLGLPPNCPVENRQLAVALADLILNWEYKKGNCPPQQSGHFVAPNQTDLSLDPTGKGGSHSCMLAQQENDFHLTMTMIEMVANFLVRLALFASDNKETAVQQLAPHCLALFTATLRAWPNAHIRFSYFEKVIATSNARLDTLAKDPPYSPALLATCLEIMHTSLGVGQRPNAFLLDNLTKAQLLICPCFFIQNQGIQSKLQDLISRIVELYPPTYSCSPTMSFYQRVKYVIESCLTSAMITQKSDSRLAWTVDSRLASHVLPVVGLINAAGKHAPAYVSNHGQILLRVGQILVFQHLDTIRKTKQARSTICHATPILSALAQATKLRLESSFEISEKKSESYVNGDTIDVICMIFSLLAQAVTSNSLSGVRRELVVLMFVCLERSDSAQLLLLLSKLVCGWLTMVKSPLCKTEKIAFVEHMMDVDTLSETSLQPLFARVLCTLNRVSVTNNGPESSQLHCPESAVKHPREQSVSSVALLALHSGVRAAFRGMFVRNSAHGVSHHIIKMFGVNWSPLSNRFWLVVLIEIVLDGLDDGGPLRLTSESMWVPTLPSAQGTPTRVTARVDVTLQRQYAAARCCLQHQHASLKNFIEPLKEIVHAHIGLAEKVWIDLIPHIGCSIKKGQRRPWQIALTNSILKNCLTPHFQARLQVPTALSASQIHVAGYPAHSTHFRPILGRLNLSQSSCFFGLVRVISTPMPRALIQACSNLPKGLVLKRGTSVPLDAVLATAAKYHCHHAALRMIEQIIVMQQNITSKSSLCSKDFNLECASLFHNLHEKDIKNEVLSAICIRPMTSIAFSLCRYGFVAQAQEALVQSMVAELRQGREDKPKQAKSTASSIFEADIWCSSWLDCACDMSQWSLLGELLKCTPEPLPRAFLGPGLRLQAYWKSSKWDDVRKYLKADHTRENLLLKKKEEQVTPQIKLLQTRLAIVDGIYTDVEILCGECVQLALDLWNGLPRPRLGIAAHDKLLHLFHELVEVHESSQLLHEAFQHARAQTYPDLRTIAQTWRNRLPSDSDSLSDWDDIMLWREQVYLSIKKAFSWGTASKVSQLHDAPWTVLTLASAARKRGLGETGISSFHASGRRNDVRMEVDDVFCKLREQILAHRSSGGPRCTHARTGLCLINSTPMSLFHSRQRSELLRLKGIFLGALGRYREAHGAFSSATRASGTHGRAWYSWAVLCDSSSSDILASGLLDQLSKNSFLCHLAAIECGYARALVCGVARILCLLRLCKNTCELQHQFEAHSDIVPTTAWVPWIPQLLSMLHDVCGVIRPLLLLANLMPQALFYSVKSLATWDLANDLTKRHAHHVIAHLHLNNPVLTAEMETLADEMIASARPTSSEELLQLLYSVQKSCRGSSPDQRSGTLYKLLHKVSSKYTGSSNLGVEWVLRQQTSPAHRHDFVFNPKEQNAFLSAATVQETPKIISARLDSLSEILAARVAQTACFMTQKHVYPRPQLVHPVGMHSPCTTSPLEIPGQYGYTMAVVRPELHLSLIHVESPGFIIRNGKSVRRYAFVADEGRVRIFARSILSLKNAQANERISQFLCVVDFALVHSHAAQHHRLRICPLMSVAFGPHLRMIEHRWSWKTMCEIDSSRRTRLGHGTHSLVSHANEHIRGIFVQTHSSKSIDLSDLRRAIYNKICTNEISADLLTRHVHTIVDSFEAAWAFRRTCAAKLGIPSVIGCVFAAQIPTPQETLVCQHTGHVHIHDFRPALMPCQNKPKQLADLAPFRLTRNIERLLQPFLLHSTFKSTMGAILLALESALQPGELLDPYICLFLSSEIHADYQGSTMRNSNMKIVEAKRLIVERIIAHAPPLIVSSSHHIEANLTKLIHLAQSPNHIAIMEPRWQPWL